MYREHRPDIANRIRGLLGVFLCMAIYLLWFMLLERKVTNDYHIIHVGLDDYIPFCEYFIIPYLLWFVYVAGVWAYFWARDWDTFSRMSRYLFGGMFASLFICSIYPNGTDLRPVMDTDANVFTALCGMIWSADTPTNVLPSVHVFNSIGIHTAILRSARTRDNRLVTTLSLILCVSICLSTVFLKQHSCADVLAAGLLSYAMYGLVYEPEPAVPQRERFRRPLPGRSED